MKKKILAVDDSNGWRNFHLSTLKQIYGDEYIVERASSAREGYDKIYQNLKEPYDLVITDLQMELDFEPKLAGEWLVEQIKNMTQYNNVPIILISATYNIRMIAETFGVYCLPKSIAVRDLNAYQLAIEEALR